MKKKKLMKGRIFYVLTCAVFTAAGIAFLLGDEASYINGACLDINGGSQMH